jgi:hypothetical protein
MGDLLYWMIGGGLTLLYFHCRSVRPVVGLPQSVGGLETAR